MSEDSPEPAPQDEEGKGIDPIIECPTTRGTLEGAPASMDAPGVSADPVPPREPTVATVISTSMEKDQGMGAACVSTVTDSMEILNLEALSVVVGCQGATVEELVEEDLAEGCP